MRLDLDSNVYCLEAVQKAAYRFINRLTILISLQPGLVLCEIEVNPGLKRTVDDLLPDLKRELLDQQLRVKIKAETESVRNLILALAFSEASVSE